VRDVQRHGNIFNGRALMMRREKEATMPVILWLLGVPLVVVVALMLLHVV
jgi:hypothetical protein